MKYKVISDAEYINGDSVTKLKKFNITFRDEIEYCAILEETNYVELKTIEELTEFIECWGGKVLISLDNTITLKLL